MVRVFHMGVQTHGNLEVDGECSGRAFQSNAGMAVSVLGFEPFRVLFWRSPQALHEIAAERAVSGMWLLLWHQTEARALDRSFVVRMPSVQHALLRRVFWVAVKELSLNDEKIWRARVDKASS